MLLSSGSVGAESLIDFYRYALDHNPALRARELGIDVARAEQELAAARLMPHASGNLGYSRNEFRESGNSSGTRRYEGRRAGVQANLALFDREAEFKVKGARFALSQSELERSEAGNNLAEEVVSRYLEALQADDELALRMAEKEAVEEQLDRLRFMRELEMAKVTDLYEVEAYFQGLVTKEIDAQGAAAITVERLREITGLSAQRIEKLARESFETLPGDERTWVERALQSNPGLNALRHAVDAAMEYVQGSHASHLPQVSLSASRNYANQGSDNRLTPPSHATSIGLQINIPLLDGGQQNAEIRGAYARLEIARARHESLRREIERIARTAWFSARTNVARVASTGQEVRALERSLEAQEQGFDLGVNTVVDVLNARQRLFKARSDLAKARYDLVRDHAKLRVVAGKLTEDDILEIDSWMAGGPRTGATDRPQPPSPAASRVQEAPPVPHEPPRAAATLPVPEFPSLAEPSVPSPAE